MDTVDRVTFYLTVLILLAILVTRAYQFLLLLALILAAYLIIKSRMESDEKREGLLYKYRMKKRNDIYWSSVGEREHPEEETGE